MQVIRKDIAKWKKEKTFNKYDFLFVIKYLLERNYSYDWLAIHGRDAVRFFRDFMKGIGDVAIKAQLTLLSNDSNGYEIAITLWVGTANDLSRGYPTNTLFANVNE